VDSVAFSPNGKVIATGSEDNTVKLWNASSGEILKSLQGHTATVSSVAFSPDSKVITTGGSYDKTVQLWDAHSGKSLNYNPDINPLTKYPIMQHKQWQDAENIC
jgi:WD40 repeat protein